MLDASVDPILELISKSQQLLCERKQRILDLWDSAWQTEIDMEMANKGEEAVVEQDQLNETRGSRGSGGTEELGISYDVDPETLMGFEMAECSNGNREAMGKGESKYKEEEQGKSRELKAEEAASKEKEMSQKKFREVEKKMMR